MDTQDGSPPQLEFIWDPVKAAANIAKHGVSFPQAATVLADPWALTVFDGGHSQLEDRWFTLGMASGGKLLAIAHTFVASAPHVATVRLISAREATRNERRQYEEEPR